MKQIIYGSLFVLCFLVVSIKSIQAQDVSSAAFVKTNSELDGFNPDRMSDNGRFLVCNIAGCQGNTVKMWDTELDIVTTIGVDCHGYDISNDGKVIVGVFLNPDVLTDNGEGKMIPTVTAGFHKDGKWTMAEVDPNYSTNLSGAEYGCVFSVSPDGKWMGGHTSYAKGGLLKPAIWNGEGKFVRSFGMEGTVKQRASLRGISADGTKGVGWSEVANDVYYFGNWIPSYWNDLSKEALTPEIPAAFGYMEGLNNAGTIAVGHSGTDGIIIYEDGTVTKLGSKWLDISENGIIVGNDIYKKELGVLSIDTYITELYGAEFPFPPAFITSISDNGEYMSVTTIPGPYGWATAFVRVSGDVLPTRPMKVSLIGGEKNSVSVYWELPLFNGYNPIGYNVYRDNVKVNTTLITSLTFNDPSPVIGKNCYAVSAVYKYRETDTELESKKTEAQCVEVISEDGCFSPKKLAVAVEYNRIVNLTWQRPAPIYKSESKDGITAEPVKLKPAMLKKISGLGSAMHVTSDGEFFYTMGGGIGKYALDGEFIGNVNHAFEFFPTRGVTYNPDGDKFYTCLYENIVTINSMTGQGEDVQTENLELGGFTRIAYLPFLNEGKGGFEVGDFDSKKSYYLNTEFKEIAGGGIPEGGDIRGVAYYKDIMYVAKRESNHGMKIYLYDAKTNKATGEYIDMEDYTNLNLSAVNDLWGVTVMNSSEGIPCLAVLIGDIIGGWRDNNFMVYLELGAMEGLTGYDVYKNDVKLTPKPITDAFFTEKIFTDGNYRYEVTAVFDNNCTSVKSEPVNIKITPIGVVNPAKNISAEIIRNNVIVSWEAPKSSSIPKLVGYNIFRDGVQLNKEGEYLKNTFYTDKDLHLGDYNYSVEAFYDNSGISEKIEAIASLKGFNPTLAPTNLELATANRGDVSLTWNAPAMGDYELKTWNIGTIENTIGTLGGGTVYVASKWDATDLNSFFDYTLTDVEFYSTMNIAHTFYIYVDDELVSTQEMATVAPNQYNLLKLDRSVSIKKGKSLMVAYKVTHKAEEYPIGTDRRENVIGKGDLVSEDGVNWYSSSIDKLAGNWAITIRLMPYSTPANTKIDGVVMVNNGRKGIKLVSAEVTRNANNPILKNVEVIGYNVYKNNSKINTTNVDVESFKDSSADLSIDNCYSIEALFTANRTSPKSLAACTFGRCLSPSFTGEIVNGYPELKFSTADAIVENSELRFYNEENSSAVGLGTKDAYYALLQYKTTETQALAGNKITALKVFVDAECKLWLFVKQGDKVLLEKAVPASSINIGEMNTFMLDDKIDIDGSKSLLIGFKVQSVPGKYPIGIDAGPGISFRGDVVAMKLDQLSTLKLSSQGAINGNWNISVSLEKNTKLNEERVGYNIYRNDVKINAEVVIDGSYVDKSAEGGKTYIYHATALWDTNCESEASDKVSINLTVVNDLASANINVYPNPAKDMLNIEGDVKTVRFYNLVGQEYSQQNVEGGRTSIDVSAWARGIYIIEVISATGEVNRGKVIIK